MPLVQVRRACLAFGVLISVLPHDSDIKQIAVGSHFYLISDHDSLRVARFHKHRDMLRNCHPFPQRGACKSNRRLSVCPRTEERGHMKSNATLMKFLNDMLTTSSLRKVPG